MNREISLRLAAELKATLLDVAASSSSAHDLLRIAWITNVAHDLLEQGGYDRQIQSRAVTAAALGGLPPDHIPEIVKQLAPDLHTVGDMAAVMGAVDDLETGRFAAVREQVSEMPSDARLSELRTFGPESLAIVLASQLELDSDEWETDRLYLDENEFRYRVGYRSQDCLGSADETEGSRLLGDHADSMIQIAEAAFALYPAITEVACTTHRGDEETEALRFNRVGLDDQIEALRVQLQRAESVSYDYHMEDAIGQGQTAQDRTPITHAMTPDTREPRNVADILMRLKHLTPESAQGTTTDQLAEAAEHMDLQATLTAHLDEYIAQRRGEGTSEKDDEQWAEAEAYFKEVDSRIGMTPVAKVAEVYGLLPGTVDKSARDALAKKMIGFAFDQHLDNPPQFLSHGFDHTMSVLRYTDMILTENPEMIAMMQDKYGISPEVARFMLYNVTLFHDVGYPHIGKRSKGVHSVIGANMVSTDEMKGLYGSVLASSGVAPDNTEALVTDLRDAILFHNADTDEGGLFQAKIKTTNGEFLIRDPNDLYHIVTFLKSPKNNSGVSHMVTEVIVSPDFATPEEFKEQSGLNHIPFRAPTSDEPDLFRGRSIDMARKGDQLLGIEYKVVDALGPNGSPMHAVIRLADNLDICNDRFTRVQRSQAFKEIYRRYGDHERFPEADVLQHIERGLIEDAVAKASGYAPDIAQRISVHTDKEQMATEWKLHIADTVLGQQPDMPDQLREQIRQRVITLDSKQLRHWGGSDTVESVVLHGPVLTITVDAEKYPQFNDIKAREYVSTPNGRHQTVKVGVGEYQIWRAYQAYSSIIMDGKQIRFVVQDTTGKNIDIPGITDSKYD